jgi:hydroxymethylpyrimidine/phosphomethylpyrimidine kinase
MPKRKAMPVAVTIAGSDSGGGAGIEADLKTFAALKVHGTAAITCVTAQNPIRVKAIEVCSPRIVRMQLEAIFDAFKPGAVKIGMLYSAELIAIVSRFMRDRHLKPVVDPVMVSTSGTALLTAAARRMLLKELLPRAWLLMPNVPEAEDLLGSRIRSVEDMRAAARQLNHRFGCAILLKGGHLAGINVAADIYFDSENELLLSAPFIRGTHTHGTGCTYSAAVTAYLARGCSLPNAVALAKQYITQSIASSRNTGRHDVLG